MKDRARLWIIGAAALVTVLAVGLVIATVMAPKRAAPPPRAAVAAKPLLPAPPARPFLMFVSLIPDASFKHVVIGAHRPGSGQVVRAA